MNALHDTLACPHCGQPIALNEALAARVRSELEGALAAEQQQRLHKAVEQARLEASAPLQLKLQALELDAQGRKQRALDVERRELEVKHRSAALEQAQRDAEPRLRLELESKWRTEADARARSLADAAANHARQAAALELTQARELLAAQQAQTEQAQQAELALRRQADAVLARERALELELARQLEARRGEWEGQWRASQGDEQMLKLREKERQIDDLRRVIGDLQRKSEQGSHERQGESLELDFEATIGARFPHDLLRQVPRGVNGADLIQQVRDASLADCGAIVWEIKHTRAWQPAWLAKLRDDQRACGAAIAVLVSVTLPETARGGFALIDGVWVCALSHWPALATALRVQLQQVAFARNARTDMNDKMQALHEYLAGDAFRHKVEAIVEAFSALHGGLARERRAMEKLWKERERQLDRVITSTAGMYGELRGTLGSAMAPIAALELDGECDDAGAECELASLPVPVV